MANHIKAKRRANIHYNLMLGLGLGLIVMMASACTPAMQQATPTAMATITPMPTATTTPDPFAGWNKCYTWRDAKVNCVVSLEDLKSGKLVDYARAVTEPFPADAFGLKIERWDAIDHFIGPSYKFSAVAIGPVDEATEEMLENTTYGYGTNNEVFTDPRSPIGEKLFFYIDDGGSNELKYGAICAVIKIKNVDGSDGFYTIIQFAMHSEESSIELFDDIFEGMYYQPPLYYANYIFKYNWKDQLPIDQIFIWTIANDPINPGLLDQWAATGIVPKDLEKRPLLTAPISNLDGIDFPWTKK